MHTLVPGQRIKILILIVTILSASASSITSVPARKDDKNNTRLFAYDPSRAFDLKEESTKQQDGVTIRDVNYAAYAPKHGLWLRSERTVLPEHWIAGPGKDRHSFTGLTIHGKFDE